MSPPEPPEAPSFAEPWQASAFALVVALHERGLFTWPEWAAALSDQISAAGAADDGARYHEHWLAALEALLAANGCAEPEAVECLALSWARAAEATPHGRPIRLENDPLATA